MVEGKYGSGLLCQCQLYEAVGKRFALAYLKVLFLRALGEQRNAVAKYNRDIREHDFIDQPGVQEQRVELAAANEPDILPCLLLQLLYKIRWVFLHKLYMLSVRELAAAENVVGFVGVGEGHVEAKDDFVGAVPHQGGINSGKQGAVTVVFPRYRIPFVVQPGGIAIRLGNIAI